MNDKKFKELKPHKKMKSSIAIVLFIIQVMVLICFVTACQPTPEKPVIIQKDNFEDLVEQTAQPDTDGSLQQYLSEPNEVTWENEFIKKYPNGANTTIRINVDAAVDARQKSGSVFIVEPDTFDLKFAKNAVDYFMGDEYYDDVYTKADLMLKILPMEQAILCMEDLYGCKDNANSLLRMYKKTIRQRAGEKFAREDCI